MSPRLAALLLSVLALPACQQGRAMEAPVYTTEERDGVTFVSNAGPVGSRENVWTVGKRPRKIGNLDGPLEFTFGTIAGAGWLPDDRLFVADSRAHVIYIFDRYGKLLRTANGYGQAADAFERFHLALPYGDSVVLVDDGRRGTVTVLDSDLSYARGFTNPFSAADTARLRATSRRWFVMADGSFVVTSMQAFSTLNQSAAADSALIMTVSADGAVVDTVGSYQYASRFVNERGRRQAAVLSPVGGLVARGSRIAWGSGERFELVDANQSGEIQRVVSLTTDPVPVTDEIKAKYLEVRIAALDPKRNFESRKAELESSMTRSTFAKTLPGMSPLMRIDRLGWLWVARYELVEPTERTHWEVFDPQGVWVGSVATPANLDVREISEDEILGVVMDDFSVPFIQIHRLSRR